MNHRSIKRAVIGGLLAIIVTLFSPGVSRADSVVLPGWDLFETVQPDTELDIPGLGLTQFKGVSIGNFNFEGIGVRNTFNADTIVRRLDQVNGPQGITRLEMVGLQLRTVDQINPGAGLDFYYVTLQSDRGGPASTGTMTVSFDNVEPPLPTSGNPQPTHGTFDSAINVAFDVRKGSLTGPVVLSMTLPVTSRNIPWSHFPPDGCEVLPQPCRYVMINGVNFRLNGDDQLRDFWTSEFEEMDGKTGIHRVRPATVPEPGTILLLGTGLAGVAGVIRKRFRRQND